ncbi:unnamed protein product [Boreogadus saida]
MAAATQAAGSVTCPGILDSSTGGPTGPTSASHYSRTTLGVAGQAGGGGGAGEGTSPPLRGRGGLGRWRLGHEVT